MNFKNIKKYVFNCFLLTIPILLWNFIFTDKLPKAFQPAIFWNDIPAFITYGENISRIMMFVFICLMPLKVSTNTQKKRICVICGRHVIILCFLVNAPIFTK